jgi:CRP-like cAMP-binding protein
MSLNEELMHASLKLLLELTPYGELLSFQEKTLMIKTDDENDSVYFLMEGQLDILVGGETVSTLKRKGDLVGEMSIVSQGLCTADVVAHPNTCVLKIAAKSIKNHNPEFEVLLYRVFCLTLGDKLEMTNLKARDFESLNRKLEEEVEKRTNDLKSQNNELTLGYKKLETMHAENVLIVNQLANLEERTILESIKLLEEGSDEKAINTVKMNLKLFQNSLSPFRQLKNTQENLKGQKVLVVESNAKQRNLFKVALGGTGVSVELAKSVEDAKALLMSAPFGILFLSAEMIELADFVKENDLKVKIVLSTEEESKEYISKIKNYHFISNIIATKQDDRAFSIKSVSTTVSKMTSGNIFGLEKYLNWGVEVREVEISDSTERESINEKVIQYLTELGIKNNIRTRCQIVIEELLMNAIYDAPTGSDGVALHNHKPRSERIILSAGQKAKLKFATDGIYLGISVEDPFGVFKKETIFKYLVENYSSKGNTDQNNVEKGGAGKGLYMISENSDLVIYNVAPQSKTEVIALFDLDPAKEKTTTSLHYFEVRIDSLKYVVK